MNLQEFQEQSKRTMPFGGEPKNPIEVENMLGNYSMGLVGEAIEAFRIQPLGGTEYKFELGDVTHYAVGLACLFGRSFYREIIIEDSKEFLEKEKENIMHGLLIECGRISENAKKRIYHRHEMDWDDFDTFGIIESIMQLCKADGIDFNEVLEMNINKLKTRYPERFTVKDSIKRVDTK